MSRCSRRVGKVPGVSSPPPRCFVGLQPAAPRATAAVAAVCWVARPKQVFLPCGAGFGGTLAAEGAVLAQVVLSRHGGGCNVCNWRFDPVFISFASVRKSIGMPCWGSSCSWQRPPAPLVNGGCMVALLLVAICERAIAHHLSGGLLRTGKLARSASSPARHKRRRPFLLLFISHSFNSFYSGRIVGQMSAFVRVCACFPALQLAARLAETVHHQPAIESPPSLPTPNCRKL